MAQYWKKTNGILISVMDFNEVSGRSKRMMKDQKLFSNVENKFNSNPSHSKTSAR